MAFQIKNFTSIVASMINYMKSSVTSLTDFNVGSVVRTLVEAPAIEIDELYQQMFIGLQEAIPVATYNSFDFTRKPSTAAFGLVTITINQSATDVKIQAGSTLSYVGGATQYTTAADATISAGNTVVKVLVDAVSAGALGNIPAGTSFTVSPSPTGFISAINAADFRNGKDIETDDQRKQRFRDFIAALQRGTDGAIEYGLKTTALYDANGITTEVVATASVIEPYETDPTKPTGLVNCYVHNGVGNTSAQLLSQAQKIVDGYYDADGNPVIGWKAAGVVATVSAASELPTNYTAVLTAATGYAHATLTALASAAVANYMAGLGLGQTLIMAETITLAMSIPGVSNFVPSAPTADVTASKQQKIMPDTLAIT